LDRLGARAIFDSCERMQPRRPAVRCVRTQPALLFETVTLLWQPFPMPKGRRAQAWRYQPAYRRPAHLHDQPEINLIVRGTATFVTGSRHVEANAGALLWYSPGLDHFLERASPDLELHVVGYEPELLDAFGREHSGIPSFVRPLQHLGEGDLRTFADAFARAAESSDNAAVEQRLLRLLARLLNTAPPSLQTLGHRTAALLLRTPSLQRDELTRRLGSNRGDVSRKFRSEQGLSLPEYKNRLRTLRLLAQLERGHDNLTRAAIEAGFGSYSRCYRVIRSLLGVAPNVLLDRDVRHSLADRFEPYRASLDIGSSNDTKHCCAPSL